MSANHGMRLKIAVTLLILLALSSNFEMLRQATRDGFKPSRMDQIVFFEKRFDEIKNELPRNGVIGYISDMDPREHAAYGAEYFLTQYALAPIIVDNTVEHPIVVGNFHNDYPDPDLIAANKLRIHKKFMFGIVLLDKDAR